METKQAAFAARGDEPIAGTVVVGDGETFNVGEALEEGDGVIVVVSGGALERSLGGFSGLETVKVPDGAEAIDAAEEKVVDVKASQAAKNKAAELGVDLATVEGSGSKGAITVEDVEKASAGESSSVAGDEAGNGEDGS